VDKVLGGWQINGNTTFQSGSPLQITGGNGAAALPEPQRPNWNGQNPTLSGSVTAVCCGISIPPIFPSMPFHFRECPASDAQPAWARNGQLRYFPVQEHSYSRAVSTAISRGFLQRFQSRPIRNPNTSINSSAFGVIRQPTELPAQYSSGIETFILRKTLIGFLLLAGLASRLLSAAAPVTLTGNGIRVDVSTLPGGITEAVLGEARFRLGHDREE